MKYTSFAEFNKSIILIKVLNMSDLTTFWWAHENLWFDATLEDDKLITQKFCHLISDSFDPSPVIAKSDPNQLIHYILLYDQIIRHVYRGETDKIQKLSVHALRLSIHIINNGLDKQYQPKERVFILMPLRHTFQLHYLELAFGKIILYRQEADCKYYIRFYKATILAMSKIKTPLIQPEAINAEISNEQIIKTLDPECIKNLQIIKEVNKWEPIYSAFESTIRKIPDLKEVTLSLSGGVDSMISSFILYHLSAKQTKFKIIAVTIDYGNREDNTFEVEFVKRWCKLLAIRHYVKHITELKRSREQDRNLYEEVTRILRFDIYRRFGNPVFLGHNLGDCLENIFSNIKKTRSFNNLRGMSEFSEEEGCQIVRPMLNVTKADIKDFAKRHMIPFLPNSTPNWSQRGKMRDILIPSINNFDPDLIPGLLKLADNIQQLYSIYDSSVIDRFYNSTIFDEYKVRIPIEETSPEREYGFVFWKTIISKILIRLNFRVPSNKSIESFTDRVSHNQYGQIKLSEQITFNYTVSGLIFKLKDEPKKIKKAKRDISTIKKINFVIIFPVVVIFLIYVYFNFIY